jgi:MYXO-CTERM domain-containing protein
MLLARSMTARRSNLGVFVVAASLLTFLVPQIAWGQECPSVSLSVIPVVPRYSGPDPSDTKTELYPLRPQNENPTWIDEKDCKDDIRLDFTVLMSGLPCTDTIQVWAGTTDCTQVSARQANSGATHCWPVTAPGTFAMSATATADIRAQDIVHYITNPEPPTIYAPGDVTACQSLVGGGPSRCGGVSLGLYFMAIEADGETVDGTSAVYDLGAYGGSCRSPSADGGSLDVDVVDAGAGGSSGAGGSGSAGSDGEGSGGTIIHGCSMAPGRGSGVGVLGGVAIGALVFRRRRRARTR